MSQSILSEQLYVKDLFDNKKWYRIPSYQRPYVWEYDQVSELLDDVMQALQANPDSDYFLGSLVLQMKKKKEDNISYFEFDLLDGQQRLTTLFLILAVLRDLNIGRNELIADPCKNAICQSGNPLMRIPERIRIEFAIREEVKEFVNQYVKTELGTQDKALKELSGRSKDISIKNMSAAILTINEFFNDIDNHDEYFKYLLNNVLLIYVASERLDDAFRLFTVLNNRGVTLRNCDILKVLNLAEVPPVALDKYAKKWESLEEYFGEKFDNFLSHVRTILVKQKAGASLIKEFESNIYSPTEFNRATGKTKKKDALIEKGAPTFDLLVSYSSCFMSLFDEDHFDDFNDYEFYNYIVLMQYGIEADFWIAPLLRFYKEYGTERLVEFLRCLDRKFSADWIVGITPTLRMQNMISIIKAVDTAKCIDDVFKAELYTVNKADMLRVLSGDIYRKRFDKYVLMKIDLDRMGTKIQAKLPRTMSIEHILPQTPAEKSKWIDDYPPENRKQWVNKLGNLIFLSRTKNTSQGNKDYTDKKKSYFLKSIETFSHTAHVLNKYDTWEKEDLMSNHTETLKQIMKLYGFDTTNEEIAAIMENI